MWHRIRTLYLNNGFRLFNRVYSRFWNTHASLPSVFNFAVPGNRELNYFETMEKQGYRIRVYQTDILDFCSGADFDLCQTYPAMSPHLLQEAGVSFTQKFALIYGMYTRQSFAYFGLTRAYQKLARRTGLPELRFGRELVGPIPSLVMLEQVAREASEISSVTSFL